MCAVSRPPTPPPPSSFPFRLPALRGAGPPAGWKLRLREVRRWSQVRAQPSRCLLSPALHQLGFHEENRLCPGGKQMRFRLLTIKIIAVQTGQRPAGSQTLWSLTAGESGVGPRTPTTSCGAGLQCPGLAQPAHACVHTHTPRWHESQHVPGVPAPSLPSNSPAAPSRPATAPQARHVWHVPGQCRGPGFQPRWGPGGDILHG